jgi:hypothetical protein
MTAQKVEVGKGKQGIERREPHYIDPAGPADQTLPQITENNQSRYR